jgi:hypothetical protein
MNVIDFQGGRPRAPHLPGPSVGSTIKKMIAINPELGADEMIRFIKQSLRPSVASGEFAGHETLDEQHALALARASLRSE